MNSTKLLLLLFTGLSAGLFLAWQISVIPGTKKVSDQVYLETMQHINREILNPIFFVVFLAPIVLSILQGYQHYTTGTDLVFWLIITASIIYIIGTFGVTGLGNVPLNDMLEVTDLSKISPSELELLRIQYEPKWNLYHLIRTICAVLSFGSLLLANHIQSQ